MNEILYILSSECDTLCVKVNLNFYNFRIPNLHPEAIPPEVKLRGRSLLPYCHFELEESDYISGGRRNPELPGPGGAPPGTTLNPNTKVVEFQSCGVKVKVVRFVILV